MRRIPILVVSKGALEGARMPIPLEGLVVGREPSCDFVLSEQGVSREHCRILVHNSGVWVRDLGSRNGVFLKGKRVNRPKQMTPGDALQVGEHIFTLELGALASGEDTVSVVSVGAPPLPEPPEEESSPLSQDGTDLSEDSSNRLLPVVLIAIGLLALLTVAFFLGK